jgi:hypothetical protein
VFTQKLIFKPLKQLNYESCNERRTKENETGSENYTYLVAPERSSEHAGAMQPDNDELSGAESPTEDKKEPRRTNNNNHRRKEGEKIMKDSRYYIDYIYDHVTESGNYYYQLVRRSDDAILYANRKLDLVFAHCFKMGIINDEVTIL